MEYNNKKLGDILEKVKSTKCWKWTAIKEYALRGRGVDGIQGLEKASISSGCVLKFRTFIPKGKKTRSLLKLQKRVLP